MRAEHLAKAIASIAVCVAGSYVSTIPGATCMGTIIILGGLGIIWGTPLLSINGKSGE